MTIELRLPKRTSKKRLCNIQNPKKRIWHLFGIYSAAYQDHKNELMGFIDMIGGLEYHFRRHQSFERRANKGLPYGDVSHEALAYLNVLGRLEAFFRSTWFCQNDLLRDSLPSRIPTLLSLMPIRNKVASHRQQDAPQGDDCKSLGLNVHKLMPGLLNVAGERGWKIKYAFPTNQRHKLLKGLPRVGKIEYFCSNNVIIFCPSDQHETIIREALDLMELFLKLNSPVRPACPA